MTDRLVSFKELEIHAEENITLRIETHTSQAGSVFRPRGEALKAFKIAEGHVKYTKGKLEMDVHKLGYIPVEDDPDKKIKITGASVKAYVESHPDTIQAREEEAEAAMHLDNCRALANTYLDVKEHLRSLQHERKNEFYSDPSIKTESNGLEEFNQN